MVGVPPEFANVIALPTPPDPAVLPAQAPVLLDQPVVVKLVSMVTIAEAPVT